MGYLWKLIRFWFNRLFGKKRPGAEDFPDFEDPEEEWESPEAPPGTEAQPDEQFQQPPSFQPAQRPTLTGQSMSIGMASRRQRLKALREQQQWQMVAAIRRPGWRERFQSQIDAGAHEDPGQPPIPTLPKPGHEKTEDGFVGRIEPPPPVKGPPPLYDPPKAFPIAEQPAEIVTRPPEEPVEAGAVEDAAPPLAPPWNPPEHTQEFFEALPPAGENFELFSGLEEPAIAEAEQQGFSARIVSNQPQDFSEVLGEAGEIVEPEPPRREDPMELPEPPSREAPGMEFPEPPSREAPGMEFPDAVRPGTERRTTNVSGPTNPEEIAERLAQQLAPPVPKLDELKRQQGRPAEDERKRWQTPPPSIPPEHALKDGDVPELPEGGFRETFGIGEPGVDFDDIRDISQQGEQHSMAAAEDAWRNKPGRRPRLAYDFDAHLADSLIQGAEFPVDRMSQESMRPEWKTITEGTDADEERLEEIVRVQQEHGTKLDELSEKIDNLAALIEGTTATYG